ncbi:pyridoxamine 5'-phosphate oxidase family protein [Azospirillum sp. RWY-5-1]|uniref:Pyridoxamine 5'-phosphate oxidase family protein n=1 Tax=Azospirillum oleiclasticum TaxID=2735135 RepID=A0ABX2TGZ9_9PROT|nr:pyridoxamine 5'-phosphate oxidase family protein [Azospirillum oleiclasticum]NYZ15911.1 pyridoxamine 5'-phosphate oxidase family protein [Azospirillum oleiclasticum]NYZ23610.1 pyridoxamine 5'-phosphate oxidase family protein [Azospirillum oleiclasticum]
MARTAGPDEIDKLWSMIKDVQFAMMTTQDEQGNLHSRPMATLQHAGFENGALWFFTRAPSGKAHEIQNDTHVNLAYAEPKTQDYVSVSGRGQIVRDKDKIKHLWREIMATWFPKGVDDPDIALIKVTVDSAAYWDAPSSVMVHAYGYVKAKITGEPPHPGETGKVSFQ